MTGEKKKAWKGFERMKMLRGVAALMAGIYCLFLFAAPASARDELKNTDPEKYYILLDLNNQIVTVYEKDEAGEYTRIVRRMICTTGNTEIDPLDLEAVATPTPRGIWKIGSRERFGKFAAFAGEYARYWTQIVGGVYFHSIMFGKREVTALKSSPYKNLGNNVSHGCVRLYVEDAKWLYYYACPGTVVNVSTSEPRNRALTKKLKSTLPFKEYNTLQKNFFDLEPLPNFRAWVVKDDADMRTGNGSNDKKIKTLQAGEEVEILQLGDPWCKVLHDKKEGYIKTAYLTLEQGTIVSAPDANIIKSTTYMYTEPDRNAERICKIPTYTTVDVLDDTLEGYVKIYVWGDVGYVPKSSISKGWGLLKAN